MFDIGQMIQPTCPVVMTYEDAEHTSLLQTGQLLMVIGVTFQGKSPTAKFYKLQVLSDGAMLYLIEAEDRLKQSFAAIGFTVQT